MLLSTLAAPSAVQAALKAAVMSLVNAYHQWRPILNSQGAQARVRSKTGSDRDAVMVAMRQLADGIGQSLGPGPAPVPLRRCCEIRYVPRQAGDQRFFARRRQGIFGAATW